MKKEVIIDGEGNLSVRTNYPIDIKVNGRVVGRILAFIPRGECVHIALPKYKEIDDK